MEPSCLVSMVQAGGGGGGGVMVGGGVFFGTLLIPWYQLCIV